MFDEAVVDESLKIRNTFYGTICLLFGLVGPETAKPGALCGVFHIDVFKRKIESWWKTCRPLRIALNKKRATASALMKVLPQLRSEGALDGKFKLLLKKGKTRHHKNNA